MNNNINDMIIIPDTLDQAVIEGIKDGQRIRSKQKKENIIRICGSIAAIFAVFITICISNPTLASKIPFVGNIFKTIESNFPYQGDYSEKGTHLANTLSEESKISSDKPIQENITDTFEQLTYLYGDSNQDITITPEEIFCDGTSLYLGLRLESSDTDGFGIISPTYQIEVRGIISDNTEEATFSQEFQTMINGYPIDNCTFIGMLKIPVTGISLSTTELTIHLDTLFWSHEINANKKNENPNLDIIYHILKDGGWDLTFPITIDTNSSISYNVNDINSAGYGIATIRLTPYEIQVSGIKPYETTNGNGFYGGFAVFNENDEHFQCQNSEDYQNEFFSVDKKSTKKLIFYFFEDEFFAAKCHNQQDAEENCLYKYVLKTD